MPNMNSLSLTVQKLLPMLKLDTNKPTTVQTNKQTDTTKTICLRSQILGHTNAHANSLPPDYVVLFMQCLVRGGFFWRMSKHVGHEVKKTTDLLQAVITLTTLEFYIGIVQIIK